MSFFIRNVHEIFIILVPNYVFWFWKVSYLEYKLLNCLQILPIMHIMKDVPIGSSIQSIAVVDTGEYSNDPGDHGDAACPQAGSHSR